MGIDAISRQFARVYVQRRRVPYRIRVTSPATETTGSAVASQWPAILTWRAHNAPRIESVRVQLTGNRIKATGRIVGGACAEHAAFSTWYDLLTDDNGVTRRLSVLTTVAAGERQLSIIRDEEGRSPIELGSKHERLEFAGALDVDVVLSPFFNALPIRRLGLLTTEQTVDVPTVYVNLPEVAVREATLTYTSTASGIDVKSPVADTTLRVDADGFVLDYPGLAERI